MGTDRFQKNCILYFPEYRTMNKVKKKSNPGFATGFLLIGLYDETT
jgi:hypothetical protein